MTVITKTSTTTTTYTVIKDHIAHEQALHIMTSRLLSGAVLAWLLASRDSSKWRVRLRAKGYSVEV